MAQGQRQTQPGPRGGPPGAARAGSPCHPDPESVRGRGPPLTGSRARVQAPSSASFPEARGAAVSLPTDCQKLLQPLRMAVSRRPQSLWCGRGESSLLRRSLPAMAAGASRDAPQGHAAASASRAARPPPPAWRAGCPLPADQPLELSRERREGRA